MKLVRFTTQKAPITDELIVTAWDVDGNQAGQTYVPNKPGAAQAWFDKYQADHARADYVPPTVTPVAPVAPVVPPAETTTPPAETQPE